MKGPRPTPTVLKMLRGNPGKRAINTREPQPGKLSPRVPRELVDKDARAEWRRTIVPAIDLGQITQGDRVMAIFHCALWAQWQSQATAAALSDHVVLVGRTKRPVQNPARSMANKSLLLLVKVDAELGLTPSSRSRVKVTGGGSATANPLDRFLKKPTP